MIVLDVETSGTNAQKHSILSLGALDFDDPTNQFYDECRAFDGAKVEKEALAVNGFTEEEVRDQTKKSEAELIAAFITWATDRPKDRTIAAHNVSFDLAFLRAAADRANIDFPFASRTIDIHTLAWHHMILSGKVPPVEHNRSNISSGVVLRYCGLPEEPAPHNALTGAIWHAEVIARMAYTKNIFPEFSDNPIPWQKK